MSRFLHRRRGTIGTTPGPGDAGQGAALKVDTSGVADAFARPSEPAPSRSRPVAVLVLVGVLVAGLVGDHLLGFRSRAQAASLPPTFPSLAPAGSLTATWFCPGLQAAADSPAKGRIIVANPGAMDLHVNVTFSPSTGQQLTSSRVVPPFQRTTFKLESEAPSAFTAATVTIDSGVGVVEQEVQGALGESIAPCATSSSDHWYVAAGRTDPDNTMLLSLYNPFSADAIVDLRFATDQGPTTPDAYQGIVIPGHGVSVVNIGEKVRIRTAVAATVNVRAGRLVVDKLELQGGPTFKGLSLTLGATGPGTVWYYPDGVIAKGRTEHFELYNPGSKEAQVDVGAVLERGSVDPFSVTVPAGDRVSVQVDQEGRIPPTVGQSWVVASTNGVPIVSERVMEAASDSGRVGVADTLGAPKAARRWLFAAGSASDNADEYLIVFNPGDRPVDVTLTGSGLGESVPLGPVFTLAPSTRRAVHVNELLNKGIVVAEVNASGPVVAERAQSRNPGPGLSSTIGVAG